MKKHAIQLAFVMLGLVLIVVGCEPLAAPPTLPTPEPTPSTFPVGTFTNMGNETTEYKADGSFSVQSLPDGGQGTYIVNGDEVVLKDNYCGDVEGLYSWAFDGKALTLEAVDDPCADRRTTLVASPWLKEP